MNASLPTHGGQLGALSERYRIPISQLLDFSANINPEGPPPAVLATLRSSLDSPSVLVDYPDLEQTDLKLSIAKSVGVSAEHIVVSNGFVPLLETVLRTCNIRRCLLPVPAFNEYRKALSRANIEVLPLRLTPETNFQYNFEVMTSGSHDAILLANPQNPSGVLCDIAGLLELIAAAAQRNIYVLLDEAFIDYMPAHSACFATQRFHNLIVFRSITKFYGIPGLRLAYAVAPLSLATAINKDMPPWPITTLASLATIAALEDRSYADRTRRLNEQRRIDMDAAIKSLGLVTYPSVANFILFRLSGQVDSEVFWEDLIQRHHLVLRSCDNYEALSPGHFRAAVKMPWQISLLIQGVSQALMLSRNNDAGL
jgi:threonine-phosphate decarboxylase